MNYRMMKRAALLTAALLIMLVSFGTAEGPAPAEAAGSEADLLEEAVRLGIIDEDTKLRADEPAMEKEIPAMIQAVHRHGYGKDSSYLSGMSICAENGRPADTGSRWLSIIRTARNTTAPG